MGYIHLLVRLGVVAFVLAGIVVEIGEWYARKRALGRLLRDVPAAPEVERASFQTPTLVRLVSPSREET